MDSIPPTTKSSPSPARMLEAASMTAFNPDPQTLFNVKAPTETGNPALMAACRAGFWPKPAETTLPKITSSISAGSGIPARWTASLTTNEPSWVAVKPFNDP